MFEVNVRGTENVLEAAADSECVLYVSAVNVFGNTHGTIVDETSERTPGDRPSAYDWTKYLAHQAARGRENVVIAQPGAIYGPGDHSELGAQLEQARRGKLVFKALADVGVNAVHIGGAAAGLRLVHDRGRLGESYVLGGEITRNPGRPDQRLGRRHVLGHRRQGAARNWLSTARPRRRHRYARPVSVISFARGVPAPECLAVDEIADCAKAAVERGGPAVLLYGPGGGYGPLREWIADRHGVEPARVVITSGSLQGFVFLAQQLLPKPGMRVLVEAPTYDRPIKILKRLGAEIVGVPMDDDGLVPDELPDGDFAFLYTIPTFQNPSGRSLTLERRRRLVELARDRDLLVLEDDPYGLVRYEGEPLPSLHELAGGEGIAYASSFSKTIAPGVRVGYFVLPTELAKEIEALATSTYISPPFMTQATVHEFLQRGNFEPNLERVNGLLKARRDAMLEGLGRHLPDGAVWSRPEGGYFVWLDLPEHAPSLADAERAGVTFVPGTDFFADGSGGSSLRLAFSYVTPDEIGEGVERLAGVLAGAAAPASL